MDLRLNIFVNSFNYLTQIIPALVVAPLFFRGDVDFGAITQAVAAFAFVLNAFTVIVTQFQQIASLAAVAERLGSLIEAIEERPAVGSTGHVGRGWRTRGLRQVDPSDPHSERLLVKDLTLDLPPGRKLLVTGPDGAGKTALFLAAAGLWEWGEGHIVRPGPKDVFFLPQQPFLAPGTFRDQLSEGVGPQRPADAQYWQSSRSCDLRRFSCESAGWMPTRIGPTSCLRASGGLWPLPACSWPSQRSPSSMTSSTA